MKRFPLKKMKRKRTHGIEITKKNTRRKNKNSKPGNQISTNFQCQRAKARRNQNFSTYLKPAYDTIISISKWCGINNTTKWNTINNTTKWNTINNTTKWNTINNTTKRSTINKTTKWYYRMKYHRVKPQSEIPRRKATK